mmetsp:Transcript_68379/g.160768  ORF Transcript_68379/g.160768 Transcript_68379/m.160768 type:complete len:184 (-) Transcript_68379:78-629(-)
MSEVTFTDYEITPTDTLTGVALRFKVAVSDIRKANPFLFGDSRRPLHTLTLAKTIRIPLTQDLSQVPDPEVIEALTQREKLKKMISFGMPLDEARSYLLIAEWDLKQALKEWREDAAWEIARGGPVSSVISDINASTSSKPQPVASTLQGQGSAPASGRSNPRRSLLIPRKRDLNHPLLALAH